MPTLSHITRPQLPQLFVFLTVTSSREPDLHRDPSEKCFEDPTSGEMQPFPSITDPPSIHLSLVVPAYKEQDRCACACSSASTENVI